MATYQFKCKDCGHEFTLEKPMTVEFAEGETKCPECETGEGVKVWNSTPVHGLITRKGS